MARSYYRSPLRYSIEETCYVVSRVLKSKYYKEINHKNEIVWEEGLGILTGRHFVKISFFNEKYIQISAWVEAFVYGGPEQKLSGFAGVIPKQQLQVVISEILGIISADPEIQKNPKEYVSKHSNDTYNDLPAYVFDKSLQLQQQARLQKCGRCGYQMHISPAYNKPRVTCPKCKYDMPVKV